MWIDAVVVKIEFVTTWERTPTAHSRGIWGSKLDDKVLNTHYVTTTQPICIDFYRVAATVCGVYQQACRDWDN